MLINNNKIEDFKSAVVDKIVPGIGTFINIYLSKADTPGEYQFWLYLCEWAITKNGVEIVSSNFENDLSQFDFMSIFQNNTSFINAVILDREELHLVFSNEIVVEIWGNEKLYGLGSEILVLYKDSHALTTVVMD